MKLGWILSLRKELKFASRNGVQTLLLCIILLASDLGLAIPILKYLKYSSILFALFLLLTNYPLYTRHLYTIAPFGIVVIYNLLRVPFGMFAGIPEIVFMFSSILYVLCFRMKANFVTVNFVIILFYVLTVGSKIQLDLSVDAFLKSQTSTGETNMLVFFFGLFFVYWLVSKKYVMALVNFVLVILSFKRIVFIVCLFVLCLFIIPKKKHRSLLLSWKLILLLNFALVGVSFLTSFGFFDDLIVDSTGITIGWLTQGRSTYLKMVLPDVVGSLTTVLTVGIGQGSLIEILEGHLGSRFLFHNDVYKLFVENGVLVFSLFWYFLYSKKSINQIYMAVFFNLLMFTDNVLTYTPVLTLFIALFVQFEERLKLY